jgi:hypothetical protein
MTDPGREKYSESTLKLSERYGIDPARLDAILGKPRDTASFEDARIHQPNVAPQAVRTEPIITSAPASTNIHTPPKDIRSTGSALSSGPRTSKTYTYEKQVSPATWIIALLVLGGLAAMFFFSRGCNEQTAKNTQSPTTIVDTLVKTDTLATTDTVTVPVPATSEASSAPAASPKRRTTARRSSSSSSTRNVALSTTSSFSAQERLAELKADGYSKANIRRVTKNGVTLYQVRTKK